MYLIKKFSYKISPSQLIKEFTIQMILI